MSLYVSLSNGNEPIDVAWYMGEPTVRLWIEEEDATAWLTVEQARRLVDMINTAIEKTLDGYKEG
jgi:hypothetical protein